MENFLECYHCPTAHPGFSKVIDVNPDSYLLQVHATFSSQVGPVRASALAGNGKSGVHAEQRARAVAVPLPLPVDDAQHRSGNPEHLAGALRPGRPAPNARGHGLLLRRGDVRERDRGAHGLGQPGRRGGRLARAVGAARARVRRRSAGPPDGGEREAHRRLPAPRACRIDSARHRSVDATHARSACLQGSSRSRVRASGFASCGNQRLSTKRWRASSSASRIPPGPGRRALRALARLA